MYRIDTSQKVHKKCPEGKRNLSNSRLARGAAYALIRSLNGTGVGVTLCLVWSQRSTVDYALARRAALHALTTGQASRQEACDAGVYLKRAARYHGEPAGQNCPVCRQVELVHVTYTYGDCFRADVNGRARQIRDLPTLAHEHDEFRVYIVEVCLGCGWNHLTTSFTLGTGRVERPGRRARSGR